MNFTEAYEAHTQLVRLHNSASESGLVGQLVNEMMPKVDDAIETARINTMTDAVAAVRWLEGPEGNTAFTRVVLRRLRWFLERQAAAS